MFWLVLQTFLLVAVAVAIGVAIGAAGKLRMGRPRPALAVAGGPDAAVLAGEEPPRPPQAPDPEPPAPAMPAPTATVSEPEPETIAPPSAAAARPAEEPVETTPPSAADAIIDAGKAGIADQVGVRPAALPAPRDRKADDLKAIKGIGPQNEARLNALGIFHFAQIAAWTPDEARWVGAYLAFPGRIEREDWIGQARSLAADPD